MPTPTETYWLVANYFGANAKTEDDLLRFFDQTVLNLPPEKRELIARILLGGNTDLLPQPIAEAPQRAELKTLEKWLQALFSEFCGKPEARDLTQDFMVAILELPPTLQLEIIRSKAKAAELAMSLVNKELERQATDAKVRRNIGADAPGPKPRLHLLEETAKAFDALTVREREVLEDYWTTKSSGGVVSEILQTKALEISRDLAGRVRQVLG